MVTTAAAGARELLMMSQGGGGTPQSREGARSSTTAIDAADGGLRPDQTGRHRRLLKINLYFGLSVELRESLDHLLGREPALQEALDDGVAVVDLVHDSLPGPAVARRPPRAVSLA